MTRPSWLTVWLLAPRRGHDPPDQHCESCGRLAPLVTARFDDLIDFRVCGSCVPPGCRRSQAGAPMPGRPRRPHPRRAATFAAAPTTGRLVAALTAGRWPTGERVIDIDERVLADLVVPHLRPLLRGTRMRGSRTRQTGRTRP